MTARGVSRREFLRVSAAVGGGLVLAVSLKGCAPDRRNQAAAGENDPTIFVRIDPDDTITVTIPKSDMGQGVRTALAMLVAEELDADWDRVRVENAPYDPKYGEQGTGGSSSVSSTHTRLRTAGGALRAMLIGAAAAEWGVEAGELTTERSTVRHPDGREAGYGSLIAGALTQPVPAEVALKPRSEWRILGTDRTGLDVPDIVHGQATFGMDLRLPGMLYAAIERPRTFGATVRSFNANAALAVPGVRQVFEVKPVAAVQVHGGVAVVAENTWAALEGRRALQVEWDQGPHAGETTEGYRAAMRGALEGPGAETVLSIGDADGALTGQVIRADYEFPFLSHATMEPMNCTARVTRGSTELWSPTQFPDWSSQAVAAALGIPISTVTTHVTLMGGGFGRRINPDYSVEAALVAREVDAPVMVVWTRTDDLGHDFYRPCGMHRAEATLGPDGLPAAWRHRFTTPAISASGGGTAPQAGWGADEADGSDNMFYRVPNRRVEYTLLASGVPRGWWRAVYTTHNTYVVETLIDELAERAGQDPVAYRLALIDAVPAEAPNQSRRTPPDPERLKGVLRLAAEKAGWGTPIGRGRGRGVACVLDHGSYAACVVEVTAREEGIRIDRVVVAADCGPVMNPTGARAQLEGGVHQALSSAIHEQITIADGGVAERNFDGYPLLRIGEAPPVVEAWFAETDTSPTGLGEPSVPPTPPALANAIYQATGRRIRTLPMTGVLG